MNHELQKYLLCNDETSRTSVQNNKPKRELLLRGPRERARLCCQDGPWAPKRRGELLMAWYQQVNSKLNWKGKSRGWPWYSLSFLVKGMGTFHPRRWSLAFVRNCPDSSSCFELVHWQINCLCNISHQNLKILLIFFLVTNMIEIQHRKLRIHNEVQKRTIINYPLFICTEGVTSSQDSVSLQPVSGPGECKGIVLHTVLEIFPFKALWALCGGIEYSSMEGFLMSAQIIYQAPRSCIFSLFSVFWCHKQCCKCSGT